MAQKQCWGHPDPVASFLLAGGRSSRMGADKALLTLNGQPLIANALATLRQAGLTPSIAGGHPALAAFAPLLPDPTPHLGPLSGICSALASTTAELSVFLPVDLPLLPAPLFTLLLNHAQITGSAVTLVSVSGFPQTFPVVIRQSALPALQTELAARRLGCFSAFQAAAAALDAPPSVLPVEYLLQSGQIAHPAGLPAAWWFLNLNTPADLTRAQLRSQSVFA